MIKHGKNYEAAERILEQITDDFTLWDLEILWVMVVTKRNHGHRLKSAKKLGIAYRTLRNYCYILQAHGFTLPICDRAHYAKPRKAVLIVRKSNNRNGVDSP